MSLLSINKNTGETGNAAYRGIFIVADLQSCDVGLSRIPHGTERRSLDSSFEKLQDRFGTSGWEITEEAIG